MTSSHPARRLGTTFTYGLLAAILSTGAAQASELHDPTAPIDVLPPAARLLVADANGDGQVDWPEAQTFARDYFATVDADGDGAIDRREYQAAPLHRTWWQWLAAIPAETRITFLDSGFDRRDLDEDGRVDRGEFLASTRTDYMTSDHDGDGWVSRLEFHLLGLVV